MLLEKISSGAQALRLKGVISKMNVELWKQYLDEFGDDNDGMEGFREWCMKNKIEYIESVLLKFGKEMAPSLQKVKIMDDNETGSCFYYPSQRMITMHKKDGLPLVEYYSREFYHISRFLSVFIHELYHAMQYDRGVNAYKKRSASDDNKVWYDKSDKKATYDYHSVKPLEIEAIANDTFFDTVDAMCIDDEKDLHELYPTWSSFMNGMRNCGRDPETIVMNGHIFKKLDGTPFDTKHPIEGRMVRLFIKEYLKVAQNFYYGGTEDDTGKFRAQRELGKKRKNTQQIDNELRKHFSSKTHDKYSMSEPAWTFDFYSYVKRFILIDVNHDLPMLRNKLKGGKTINEWIYAHVPKDVISDTGLTGVDLKIYTFASTVAGNDMETNISVENNKVVGDYFIFCHSEDEISVEDIIELVSQVCLVSIIATQ